MTDYEKLFANNLRRLRKAAGMTQAELGNAIGYSEKAVSKWECASGIPDIGGLFALSRKLCVGLEDLFADDSQVYFLGIDGGGTKTAIFLSDSSGTIIRKLYTDCCNPVDIGMEKCSQVLRNGIFEVCEGIALSSVVAFAGIAGGNAMEAQLHEFFSTLPLRMFACDSDNYNIMQAGLHDADGITLILGTGICAWSRKDNVISRTAGWGYFLDEGGSAFNIGQDALKHYFALLDGLGEPGTLTELIAALFPGDDQALLRQTYSGGKKWIASLASLVFQAAQAGDRAAEYIVQRNMTVAAGVIETAGKVFLHGPVPVVIAGGLVNQPCVLEYLRKAFSNPGRYQLSVLDKEPAMGAVALAQKLWEMR